MNLEQSRKTIDEIDSQLTKLFAERMSCAAEIAAYKKENNLPVLDAGRERQKLAAISELVPEELESGFPADQYSYIACGGLRGRAPHIRGLHRPVYQVMNLMVSILQKYHDFERNSASRRPLQKNLLYTP